MPRNKANLYLRYRTPDGKQSPYCPAVYDTKNRLRQFVCMVNGVEERHPEGSYYLRYKKDDGKWGWKALGTDAHTAWCKSTAAANQQELMDNRPVKSEPEKPKLAVAKGGYKMVDEVKTYLDNVAKLSKKTYKAYKLTLDYFQQCSPKVVFVHDITKQHLQKFDSFLMDKGYTDRYRHNHVQHHENHAILCQRPGWSQHGTPRIHCLSHLGKRRSFWNTGKCHIACAFSSGIIPANPVTLEGIL